MSAAPIPGRGADECPHCAKLVAFERGQFVRHFQRGETTTLCQGSGQTVAVAPKSPICMNVACPGFDRQEMVPQSDGSFVCPRCGAPAATGAEGIARLAATAPTPAKGLASKTSHLASVEELAVWWHDLAETDLAKLMPKATEYSAYDLIMIGRATAEMLGWQNVSDAIAAEIACWWYLLGKVGRAVGAIREHRLPSQDTGDDTRIYATMISRIRERGAWPGL